MSALANHQASDFFMFSKAEFGIFAEGVGAAECNGSNDATANVSGSTLEIDGRINSNSDWAASGSGITFHDHVTYGVHGENCSFQDEANNNIYEVLPAPPKTEGSDEIDSPPTGVDGGGWPGNLSDFLFDAEERRFANENHSVTNEPNRRAIGIDCDVGNLTNTTDITLTPPLSFDGLVICNGTGKVQFNISGPTGPDTDPPTPPTLSLSLTIISHGPIEISGEWVSLSPAEHGILAWTDVPNVEQPDTPIKVEPGIKLGGSNFHVPQKAILFTPRNGQDISGSKDSKLCIQIIGQGRNKVAGSDSQFGPGFCEAPPPDVRVAKTPDGEAGPPGTINAGQTATFTITVTNDGPGTVATTGLSDQLPTTGGLNWTLGAQGLNPTFAGGSACTLSPTDFLSCTITDLAQGASYRVVVTSPTSTAQCGNPIPNTVTISATGDITPANNTDTGSIVVRCGALRINKDSTKGGPVLVAGAQFTVSPHPTIGDATPFTVIDNGANDGDGAVGDVCVAGVIPGVQYTIVETVPPTGYDLPPVVVDRTKQTTPAAGGTCATGAGTVTFVDPPLVDIQARFRSQVATEATLVSPITCNNTTGASSGADTAGWDDTLTVTGIRTVTPGNVTVTCTFVIDP